MLGDVGDEVKRAGDAIVWFGDLRWKGLLAFGKIGGRFMASKDFG